MNNSGKNDDIIENSSENLEISSDENQEDSSCLEELKSENENLKKEISKLNDKYLRLAAEYKNYQERSKKEKMNIRRDSLMDSVSSILPIIDDIERVVVGAVDYVGKRTQVFRGCG